MMTDRMKAPVLFWVIGAFALLWNTMGLAAYFEHFTMSPEAIAALRPEQQNLLLDQPFWLTSAFAVAVFAGFIGSILLLARKRLAVRMFLLSMIAVFVQFGGLFLFLGYADVLVGGEWVMPILIPIFAAGFYLYARKAEKDAILD